MSTVLLLFNPVSGAGRSAAAAQSFERSLRAAGHDPIVMPTRLGLDRTWLDESLASADLLVVIGGDGAVRLASQSAVCADKPLYHAPFGTENLFAREFGMDRDPATLIRAIDRFQVKRADMGMANGHPFLLMASVGFDAEVVHELALRRGSSISHFSYIMPIWSQLCRWRPPKLQVCVDGQRIADGDRGFIVIANCKQYGWRFNPAAKASMFDGVFDVVYFPANTRASMVAWALRCLAQSHLSHRSLIYRTGRQVTVECEPTCQFQLDGDSPGANSPVDSASGRLRLMVEIQAARLPVLIPQG